MDPGEKALGMSSESPENLIIFNREVSNRDL